MDWCEALKWGVGGVATAVGLWASIEQLWERRLTRRREMEAFAEEKARNDVLARRVAKLEADRRLASARTTVERLTNKEAATVEKVAPSKALNAEPKAGTRKTILINGVEFAFRYCPPGTFGAGSSAGETGDKDEETRCKTRLTRGFWALETPVTQGMMAAATGDNPSYFAPTGRGRGHIGRAETSDFPVESVSWSDCVAFLKALNVGGYLQNGFEFRLPTETEWEYAARAGTETPFPWGEALNGDKANCNGTFPYGTNAKGAYWRRTTAVRSYPANAWGLYDVVGNVWEWCANDGELGDGINASTEYKRVLRGGSWLSLPENCRVVSRKLVFLETNRDYENGFRIIIARRDAATERRAREEAERRAREEAERRAREEAERRAREEAERRAREETERRAREEAERRAREEEERRAREVERWAREEAERRAREEEERRAREAAERRAREAKADYLLGRELAFGLNGTKVDGRRGFELLKKAADAGSLDAKAELAELYLDGCEGTSSDATRAFAAAFEAAQSDNPFALYVLGRCYDEGRRVSKDEKLAAERKARAFREFEKRAKNGDVRAKTRLGVMLRDGNGSAKNKTVGFETILEAVETGSAEAMEELASCYRLGIGVAEDEARAFEWYRWAAEAGNACAMYFLALCYAIGIGVAKDEARAFEWYRKAANAGFIEATYSLAWCYRFGKGVAENAAKAFEWFRKAADAGDAAAMWQLGDCYKDGIGVGKDTTRAFEWYVKSEDAGNALAMCRVGDCYKDGIGVGKDTAQAFERYRKAADVGFIEAMYLLGKCYEKGIGVEKNVSEAKKWYRKAAEQERYRLWKTEAEEALRRLESEAEADVAKPTLFDVLPLFASSDSATSVCEPEPAAGTRKTLRVRCVEFSFRYCPAGTFLMGSPDEEQGRGADETQHKVTLTRGFWMLETPVTQGMYEAITGKNPSWFSLNGGGWEKILELDDYDTSEFPVERVGMRACQDFLDLLSAICESNRDRELNADWEFRLPTEAEWEYACRAGTSTAYYWGDRFEAGLANCDSNASYGNVRWERTTPVGYYPSNPWGLYDMLGNVYEWCGEYYAPYSYGSTIDPTGPVTGVKGVLRGGSWNSDAKLCRSAARQGVDEKRRRYRYGFRFVVARR